MKIKGINAFEHSEQGVILITDTGNQDVISYSEALEALNHGSFDGHLSMGFELVLAICKGEHDEFFKSTIEQTIMLWRWIVAASFVMEQADNNGFHQVDDGNGSIVTAAIYRNDHAAITVYAVSERLLLANHVESTVYEQCGAEYGALMVVRMYRDFISLEPKQGCRLSERGREGLSLLNDDLIRAVESGEFNAEPVFH
ncbi:Uncharacterised protein [Providencia rustigianii]|uniref:Uncharacterized protein n=1 Tax=Providencia rustigianii TaxID=158850 RepID=A0A379G1X7_9GAMM|nr:hypothetical protein [Providencia rustigianii]SUC33974.1 Uncharacterised protein [Providencia rustigianii]SUC35060.1 Uncharacterised protein [Providencia rustigianii]SUC35074.1 Uncharacterised protein [Providencia rustigianii]